MLQFAIFILRFWAWDFEFINLVLEFSSWRVWVWDSVLGFVILCLLCNILGFLFSSLGFWVMDLEFVVWDF